MRDSQFDAYAMASPTLTTSARSQIGCVWKKFKNAHRTNELESENKRVYKHMLRRGNDRDESSEYQSTKYTYTATFQYSSNTAHCRWVPCICARITITLPSHYHHLRMWLHALRRFLCFFLRSAAWFGLTFFHICVERACLCVWRQTFGPLLDLFIHALFLLYCYKIVQSPWWKKGTHQGFESLERQMLIQSLA